MWLPNVPMLAKCGAFIDNSGVEMNLLKNPEVLRHPDFAQILQNLGDFLYNDDAKAAYYNALLDQPVNQKFAAALLMALAESKDLSEDLYVLRSINMLYYPGTHQSTVVAGQTVYYSHEYERYSQPAKEIWHRAFELAEYEIADETNRGVSINGVSRKDLLGGLMEVYGLVIFSGAPPLVQR